MVITVNGEKQTVANSGITIPTLLTLNKIGMPEMVSVQVNGEFVDKKDYDLKLIMENDEVDFLYFMGGGKTS